MANLDVGDVAGVIAGLKTGSIAASEARKLLREYGTGEDVIDSILAIGAGVVVGGIVGSVVDNLVDGLFGD